MGTVAYRARPRHRARARASGAGLRRHCRGPRVAAPRHRDRGRSMSARDGSSCSRALGTSAGWRWPAAHRVRLRRRARRTHLHCGSTAGHLPRCRSLRPCPRRGLSDPCLDRIGSAARPALHRTTTPSGDAHPRHPPTPPPRCPLGPGRPHGDRGRLRIHRCGHGRRRG